MHAVSGPRIFRISAVVLTLGAAGCGDDSTSPRGAAKLAFRTQPASTIAGRVFSPAIVVEVLDQNGLVTASENIDVQITISGNGTMAGATTARAGGGVAVFSDLRVNSAGAGYTLTASAPGLQSATSNVFGVTAAVATKLSFVSQPATAIANTALPAFSVAVQDAFGNTVTTPTGVVVVFLENNSAGALVTGSNSVAPIDGIATFTGVRVSKSAVGLHMIAQLQNLTPATSQAFDATVGPATRLTFVTQPTSTNPGRTMTDITVVIADAAGNVVSSSATSVALRIGSNPGGGTLSGTTTRNTSGSSVTFSDLTIDAIGSGYTLVASAAGLADAVSSAFDVRNSLNFASVTAGYFHTCGLTSSNLTFCWGSNGSYQLGNVTPELSRVPIQVAGSTSFSRVVAGRDHNCATTAAGTGYCWGNYGSGQLGPSATSPSTSTPAAVSSQISFTAVDAGYSHSCGVSTAGAAYCWGSNSDGQLGNSPSVETSTPALVASGFTFTSVSPGRAFTCGLRTGGAAYCWGTNLDGELGIGVTGNRLIPTAVAGGLSFTSISAGGFHACALTSAGAAYCWGNNVFGQLGNNSTTPSNTPVAVAGGRIFASISAGNRHTCGVTTGGVAYCWGDNLEGKLGTGGTTNSGFPTAVSGGLVFRGVSAGRFHTCGVTTAGLAYCWGANNDGRLGDGTVNDSFVPVAVR